VILTGYIAWVWRTPRVIGRQNWQVWLPNGPLTLLQIVIGIVDLTLLRVGDVSAGAERSAHAVHRHRGDLHHGDACSASPAIRQAGSACSTPPC
jgi:hypothetical protein